MYEIRDPVHKTIEFSEKEKKIIDHPYVQRLRFVRQLGMTFFVYPGAGGDRFSHAVGAMHVAGLVWDRIGETSGDLLDSYFSSKERHYLREILRFAALLHDVGHPPFSHVSEKFMPKLGQLDLPRKWFAEFTAERQATHEDFSVMLIAELGLGKKAVMSAEEAQDIASLVHHDVMASPSWSKKFGLGEGRRGIHSLLRSLISGELDVDRMDYLLRDAHHTGVAYGYYDVDHIIGNLGITFDAKKDLTLTIDSTAVRAFEDFLLARYHMFLQVYLHKTTLCFDYFLEQAITNREASLVIPGNAAGYLRLRDSTLIESLFTATESENNKWSKRLLGRKPAKLVLSASQKYGKTIMRRLKDRFDERSINYFVMTAKHYLSQTRQKKINAKANLLVRRKMFGKFFYEPIEKYSSLLKRYNEIIDLTNLYVLPEDWSKAKKIIERIKIKRPGAI